MDGYKKLPDQCNDDEKDSLIGVDTAKAKRRDIQGLRGLAILYVLLFHIYPKLFPRGFLGVDIFFVISGFLITMILWKERSISLGVLATFYKKRIKRIFPAYYLLLFLILLCAFYRISVEDYALIQKETLWAAGFGTNIHKYLQNLDYFPELANYDFLLHTWSLAVEIQFYLVAPLLILLLDNGLIGKASWFTIFIASIFINVFTNGPLQFSSLASRVWQFMCGSLAYFFPKSAGNRLLSTAALLVLSPLMVLIPLQDTFFRYAVTIASGLIIAHEDKFINECIFGNTFLYHMGEISYSVYLFHWPIILFIKYESNTDELVIKDAAISVILSVLFGALCFKIIEKTFLQRKFLITFTFLTAAISCIIFLAICVKKRDVIFDTGNHNSSNQSDQTSRFEKHCYRFRNVSYLPEKITASMVVTAIDKNRYFIKALMPNYKNQEQIRDPLYEKYFLKKKSPISYSDYFKGNGRLSMIVIGNSYAHRVFQSLVETMLNDIREIRLLAQPFCQPFFNISTKGSPGTSYACSRYIENTAALIDDLKPDVIFFIFMPLNTALKKFDNIEQDNVMQSIQKTIDRLSSATKTIFIQMPFPIQEKKSFTPLLLDRLERRKPLYGLHIDYTLFTQHFHYIIKRLEHLKCNKCIRIYPHRIFCDSKICRVFDPDNLFSFYDGNVHANIYANKCISKLYKDAFDKVKADGYFL